MIGSSQMLSQIKDKMTLLVAGDCVVMVAAFLFALALGHKDVFTYQLVLNHSAGLLTLILSALLIFFVIDAYSLQRVPLRFMRQTLLILLGLFLSAIVTTFTFFFFHDPVPRAVFILLYLFSGILIVGLRYYFALMTPSPIWKVLIVGNGERSEIIEGMLNSKDHLRSQVVGLLSDDPASQQRPGCPRLGDISDLLSVVDQHNIDHIIVVTGSINDELAHSLVECMKMKVKIFSYFHVIEDITGQIPVKYLDDSWFILELSNRDKRHFWYAKRSVDIGVAVAGICLAFPLFLLAALLIKLESSGPVFYTQLRTGRDNKPFKAWKLRTMIDGADKDNVHWTLDNDNRITKVGKWLRKLRFDEVPQMINMLKGEMSLIGPRPEAISLVEKYTEAIPYYLGRHMVSPGITGWAQINYRYGNSIEDTRQKLMYDYYYIKNRSVMLDTIILLRTIRTVLTAKGAM
jgi:exopolysaccharide biosynthesis polyprenyl glycosylphosphotransferase